MKSKLSVKSSVNSKPSPVVNVIGALATIIINTALLIWVIRLSAKHCGCVGGWRQDFIKYFAIVTILMGGWRLLNFQGDFTPANTVQVSRIIITILILIGLAYFVASMLNIYSVITYVDDINETKCACAIKDMHGLNQAMIVLRWVYIIGLCLFGAMILFSIATSVLRR